MTATIQTLLLLLAVLVVVAIVARRLKTAPSILLVIAGILLALTPGLPRIELAPELVLLGILPPLIYSAGVAMSWREFRFNLRPIALLAFGCVVFTTCAVAAMAHRWWACPLPSALCSVPLSHRPTRSRRCPLYANSAFRAGSLSFSKERVSPMTPRH
jgi:CPA1 family monovalent cation:H+ antiporter